MIRSLVADEIHWFYTQAFAFLGHGDPILLARYAANRIKDLEGDAEQTFVFIQDNQVKAGVHVHLPASSDDLSLYLVHPWFIDDVKYLEQLLRQVFARYRYEAIYVPLHNLSDSALNKYGELFKALGFSTEEKLQLRFELSDLPPLGLPIVLEAWSHETDELFQSAYSQAEKQELRDDYWAWLKRYKGTFQPDLWFLGRETLDQDPIGYGFFNSNRQDIDSSYTLTSIGVLPEHRHSSEMLRRLLLSCLLELASISPLGRIETDLTVEDPKLIRIFESLGFTVTEMSRQLVKKTF